MALLDMRLFGGTYMRHEDNQLSRHERRRASLLALCLQPATIKRAAITALIVGPILTLVNQFDIFASGAFTPRFYLKLVLTFVAPFVVSMTSSALADLNQTSHAVE